jgi:alpha-L-rhamnosidase
MRCQALRHCLMVLIAIATGSGGAIAWAGMRCDVRPIQPQVEGVTNPLGLQNLHPRISWQLRPVPRKASDLKQSAYQIMVSTTREKLKHDDANLWDTGKIFSSRTYGIIYAGKALRSQMHCWWKVRVWNAYGKRSRWSKSGYWTMGLLKPGDWLAHWIMEPTSAFDTGLKHLNWLWLPGHGLNVAPGIAWFRKAVVLASGHRVSWAKFFITADNRFTLFINGHRIGSGRNWRVIKQFSVAHYLHAGVNTLAVAATNGGSAPNPAGLIGELVVHYSHGQNLLLPIDTTWRVAARALPGWKAASKAGPGWHTPRVMAQWGSGPWGKTTSLPQRLPLFRHTFALRGKAASATAYICGLGQYELFINGHRISHDLLQPGWTLYNRRAQYNTYSVGRWLKPGRNTIGVMLGGGMYDGSPGRYDHLPASFGPLKLIMQLQIKLANGQTKTVVSSSAWRTHPGPIGFSSIFGGEDYNALYAIPGWDLPTYSAVAWRHAVTADSPGGRLAAQISPPIKVMQTYKPIRIWRVAPDSRTYDLGQNMAGRPVIRATGPAGSTLVVYPAELVHPNHTAWQSCAGPIWCVYTLNGHGIETFRPRFAYFGFRYLQITVAPPPQGPHILPHIISVVGQAMHSSAAATGTFSCSDTLFNQIHHLITMAMVNNMQSIITDCPTREKTGWLEDTYLVGAGIMLNYDVANLYRQTAINMQDSQMPDGMVPDFAPAYFHYGDGFENSPEWGSASILDPWLTYKYFGNTQILRSSYPMMVRYLRYLKTCARSDILYFGLGDWFDLGPRPPGIEQLTRLGVTATATWYRDLRAMIRISRLLGHMRAARRYAAVARKVRAAFNQVFFHPATAEYDRGSQCANAMALATHLVPKKYRAAVLRNLIGNIRRHHYHTTAGDIGFHYVVQALTLSGNSDVLATMFNKTSPPSYGYQIKHGATSLTEAWDCNPGDSQDHFMLGHGEEWFYNGLAGLRIDFAKPLGDQIEFQPAFVPGIRWVKASVDTVAGKVGIHWQHLGNHIVMSISVPPNILARAFVPTSLSSDIRVNHKPLKTSGISIIGIEKDQAVLAVPSGHYRITARLGRKWWRANRP